MTYCLEHPARNMLLMPVEPFEPNKSCYVCSEVCQISPCCIYCLKSLLQTCSHSICSYMCKTDTFIAWNKHQSFKVERLGRKNCQGKAWDEPSSYYVCFKPALWSWWCWGWHGCYLWGQPWKGTLFVVFGLKNVTFYL